MRSAVALFAWILTALLVAVPASAQWTIDGASPCGSSPCGGDFLTITPDGAAGAVFVRKDPFRLSPTFLRIQRVNRSGLTASGWPDSGVAIRSGAVSTPHLVRLGAGGFLLVDLIESPVGGRYWLHACRIDADGTFPAGWDSSGRILSDTSSTVYRLDACSDGQGGCLIAWQSGGPSIYGTSVIRLSPDVAVALGWPSGGVTLAAMSSLAEPRVVARPDGGAIVIGIDRLGGTGVQIRAFGFDPSGSNAWSSYPSGLVVLATYAAYVGAGGGTGISGVISDSLGGAYVAVNSGGVASSYGIDLYRVGGAGVIPAGWFSGVHVSSIVGQASIASLACAGGSGVFIGWSHITSTSTTFYMQHLRADGTIGAGWAADGKAILSAGHVIVRGAITSDLTGGVYGMALDGGNQRAYVTHLDSTGTPATGWPAGGVDASPDHAGAVIGPSTLIDIVPDGEGGAIAGWNTNFDSPYSIATRLIRVGPTQVVPTRLSLVSTLATPSLVTLEWYAATATGETFELQRSQDSGAWTTVGEVTGNGVGLLDFSDASVIPGAQYGYRLRTTGTAVYVASAETWVDVPAAYHFGLTGARPNPTPRTEAAVAFSLATNAAATLDLFDLSGRRVLSREVGSLGAGDHVLRLGSDARLDAGMYWLRLAQGANKASVRVVVTE